ncbi:MAG: alanine racemase [Acidobacteria bacterium]|nr:alanine racemase [Acidobacteriota bacterium]
MANPATLTDLETPALLIDLDRLERNLDRVAEYAREHGLRLRPHTKTHKTPEIGRMQLDRGAVGLTVAKTTEAEVMLASGTPDLLVAYPVLGQKKLERLAEVARHTRVTVAFDSFEVADGLAEIAAAKGLRFGALVEANLGMNRVGLTPGSELMRLAAHVAASPQLELEGVNFYPGNVWPPDEDAESKFEQVRQGVARLREDFERAGLPLGIVSGGSSPTLFRSHEIEGLNEIRPGTYVFNDGDLVEAGHCTWDDCAASVLTTVISTPREGFGMLDGGSKTFSSDRIPGQDPPLFGRIVEVPEARIYKQNEEHGHVDFREAGERPRIGDRLRVIPNHVCVCVNLHEKMYGIRGDRVEHVWDVRGRGKLQ